MAPIRSGGILALDCGHSFGWAYSFPGDEPVYGTIILPNPNGNGFAFFRRWLHERIAEFRPRLIVAEEPILLHFGAARTSLQTALWLCGLHSHVVEIAYSRGVRCEVANVSKIKRFLTGNGAAKKPQMIQEIENCGWFPQTSDEADALAVLLFSEAKYAPKIRRDVGVGPLFKAR